MNNFTVCFEKKSDISYSSGDFPLLDFAITTNFSSFTPLELQNVTMVNGVICGSISTTSSAISPIALANSKLYLCFILSLFYFIFILIFFKLRLVQTKLYFFQCSIDQECFDFHVCSSLFVVYLFHHWSYLPHNQNKNSKIGTHLFGNLFRSTWNLLHLVRSRKNK